MPAWPGEVPVVVIDGDLVAAWLDWWFVSAVMLVVLRLCVMAARRGLL